MTGRDPTGSPRSTKEGACTRNVPAIWRPSDPAFWRSGVGGPEGWGPEGGRSGGGGPGQVCVAEGGSGVPAFFPKWAPARFPYTGPDSAIL